MSLTGSSPSCTGAIAGFKRRLTFFQAAPTLALKAQLLPGNSHQMATDSTGSDVPSPKKGPVLHFVMTGASAFGCMRAPIRTKRVVLGTCK